MYGSDAFSQFEPLSYGPMIGGDLNGGYAPGPSRAGGVKVSRNIDIVRAVMLTLSAAYLRVGVAGREGFSLLCVLPGAADYFYTTVSRLPGVVPLSNAVDDVFEMVNLGWLVTGQTAFVGLVAGAVLSAEMGTVSTVGGLLNNPGQIFNDAAAFAVGFAGSLAAEYLASRLVALL